MKQANRDKGSKPNYDQTLEASTIRSRGLQDRGRTSDLSSAIQNAAKLCDSKGEAQAVWQKVQIHSTSLGKLLIKDFEKEIKDVGREVKPTKAQYDFEVVIGAEDQRLIITILRNRSPDRLFDEKVNQKGDKGDFVSLFVLRSDSLSKTYIIDPKDSAILPEEVTGERTGKPIKLSSGDIKVLKEILNKKPLYRS